MVHALNNNNMNICVPVTCHLSRWLNTVRVGLRRQSWVQYPGPIQVIRLEITNADTFRLISRTGKNLTVELRSISHSRENHWQV